MTSKRKKYAKRIIKIEKEIDMSDMVEVLEEDIETVEDIEEEIEEIENSKETYDNINKDMQSALELLDSNEVIIDRKQEDMDIIEFQKTGDIHILEKVYKNRIPTLKSWANKNYYPGLTTSVEDLFEDLSVVFLKAAEKYNKNRGAFNTCLFTFLLNRIKNLKNSRYAKKRVSKEYEGPLSSMIFSLDFAYSDGEGEGTTLKDIIPAKEDNEDSLDFKDAISFLSKNNSLLYDFFKKISNGSSLASLIKEYKTKNGVIDISSYKKEMKSLSEKKNKKLATEIIKSKNILTGDFKLLEYELKNKELKYKVEMRKTKETDFIIKAIRDLKKHKSFYISKVRGE